MKSFKRLVPGLVFVVLVGTIFWAVLSWKNIERFPSIISAFYAKQFCSCYFVMNRTESACHEWSRQWIPISKFELNRDAKTVTVSGLGRTTTARHLSDRYGCQLGPYDERRP